ncbi:MAG: hypothetical protein KDJ97_19955 [Anaerolineae bacterium]|nr:hypothetical protein [Anaerolineae bacterium]
MPHPIEKEGQLYYSQAMVMLSSSTPSPATLLQNLLTLDRFVLLLNLYRALRRWVIRHRHEGMYKILDYDSTLELLDAKGQTARFKRRQRVKFLQDHIIAFQDYAWGEGDIFADYTCSPGVEVDRYREGDQWNILISLRETKSAGDIIDFYTERTIKHGFVKDDEWWQVEIRHRTKQFRLAIIFPKKRRCQRAVLLQRSKHKSTVLQADSFTNLPDGRQILTWETTKLKRFETYIIQWRW